MRLNIVSFIIFILCAISFGLYSYLEMQNDITAMQIAIPKLVASIEKLEEENVRLKYQTDIFASPENLLKIAQRKEFAHLTYPTHQHIVVIRDAAVAPTPFLEDLTPSHDAKVSSSIAFAAGLRN